MVYLEDWTEDVDGLIRCVVKVLEGSFYVSPDSFSLSIGDKVRSLEALVRIGEDNLMYVYRREGSIVKKYDSNKILFYEYLNKSSKNASGSIEYLMNGWFIKTYPLLLRDGLEICLGHSINEFL